MERLFNIPNKLIAITGGIASGKTTHCKKLEKEGKEVFYVDKIVKRIYKHGPIVNVVRLIDSDYHGFKLFKDGAIDFQQLRELAFDKIGVLLELENAIQTYFEGEFLKEYMERKLNVPRIIPRYIQAELRYEDIYLEHPLVHKQGIEDKFDDIIEMYAPEDVRVWRIMKRDDCSKETAEQMIGRQRI